MKGIIFREFVDMVEDVFSIEVMDSVFEQVDLPSGGAYTQVGTYDHKEIIDLVVALHKETGVPVIDLVKTYGQHLFGRFTHIYPQYFGNQDNTFDFLKHVQDYIHKEVLKLYPDAEVPQFEFEQHSVNRFTFYYNSNRHLGDVAEGLILGCIAHFEENIELERTDFSTDALARVKFELIKQSAQQAA